MSTVANAYELLAGWGNCPVEPCHVVRPGTLGQLQALVAAGRQPSYIARGCGRAYGDAALNRDRGVACTAALNEIVSFDPQTGTIDCQGGVSLQQIIDRSLPHGWFLPTTPGTRFVSVGGAVAADVHGKNHHLDGSFGNFVTELDLLIASGEIIGCSPAANADLFWATVGGMGLTGIIVRTRLQLVRTS
ncbi:MAG TPA: FAD-binding oxidoreductase, partial [Pirellulales bacterium]|nr:FAD-binding oxidoreductase [Pirellulales bacterium]